MISKQGEVSDGVQQGRRFSEVKLVKFVLKRLFGKTSFEQH